MYIFFDVETNGLPKNYNAPVTKLSNWPRLVQIAWLAFNETGEETARKDYIIKPAGFSIPAAASSIHGISTEKAMQEGLDLNMVLKEFEASVKNTKYLVAHNMSFDEKIVGAEFLRNGFRNVVNSKKKICTMKSTTDYCAIPGRYGYKWPALHELHQKLFAKPIQGQQHNALVDVEATAKCFWELKKIGVL